MAQNSLNRKYHSTDFLRISFDIHSRSIPYNRTPFTSVTVSPRTKRIPLTFEEYKKLSSGAACVGVYLNNFTWEFKSEEISRPSINSLHRAQRRDTIDLLVLSQSEWDPPTVEFRLNSGSWIATRYLGDYVDYNESMSISCVVFVWTGVTDDVFSPRAPVICGCNLPS